MADLGDSWALFGFNPIVLFLGWFHSSLFLPSYLATFLDVFMMWMKCMGWYKGLGFPKDEVL